MLTRLGKVHRRAGNARGFSLVELMVAMVLGLLVAGAVVALVLAIIKSNRQSLRATRLNQELRATLAVVANEVRRARSVDDPLSAAMLAGGNPVAAINTANAGCIIYGYEGAAGGRWHVLKLRNGGLWLQTSGATAAPVAADCASADGDLIGSRQVEITDMTITPSTTVNTPPLLTDQTVARRFTITLTGRLVDTDASLAAVTRTMSSTIYVRSVGAGT